MREVPADATPRTKNRDIAARGFAALTTRSQSGDARLEARGRRIGKIFAHAHTPRRSVRIARKLGDKPLIANMVEDGRTPMLGNARLAEIGYALAIFPVAGLLSAAAALETVYRQILKTGSSLGSPAPLYPFAEMNRVGFEEVWRFDRAHTET